MSGAYESALQAKAALEEKTGEERVTVIDSATACGGLGMMMLGAAAVARAGGDRGGGGARARETRGDLKGGFATGQMDFTECGGGGGARAPGGGPRRMRRACAT